MEHNDHCWHWWHWLIVIAVVFIVLGIGYTWINNHEIIREDNQSYVNGTEKVIEHPIDETKNAINDVTK